MRAPLLPGARCSRTVLGLGAALVLSAAFGVATAQASPQLPKFDPRDFKPGQPVDNPYFPLKEGFTYHYPGKLLDDAGKFVPSPDNVRVQHVHKQVAGVQTLVAYDNVYLNGFLHEATQDYYAQDVHGNVWYMGEFETDFVRDKHGKIIKVVHPDTWQAGVNGGEPGFIMEAHPKVGDDYFQEHAPPTAVDTAKVTAVGLTLDVEGKTYHEVILTKELSALEPGVVDFKWYAPGIGLVLEREYTNGKLDAFSRFGGITPNGGGPKVGALDHGAPGQAQLALLLPADGGNAAALTTAHTVAYVGMPFGLPADSHIPALDLTALF